MAHKSLEALKPQECAPDIPRQRWKSIIVNSISVINYQTLICAPRILEQLLTLSRRITRFGVIAKKMNPL